MYALDMGSLNYQYGVQLECLEDTPEQLLAHCITGSLFLAGQTWRELTCAT